MNISNNLNNRGFARGLVMVLGVSIALVSGARAQDVVPAGSGIKTQGAPLGTILLTDANMPLYTYDADNASGQSSCNDKCAKTWPPLLAAADAKPNGQWTLVKRQEDGQQWAYRGSPLYTYTKDKLPTLPTGDGFQDLWHSAIILAPRPATITYRGTLLGRVAADTRGMTLYSFDRDTQAKQACIDKCLTSWIPLKAPAAAGTMGDWSMVERQDDGTPQWAYKGKPVYRFSGDTLPGKTAGDGVEGAWHAIVVQPAPKNPAWVKVVPTDYGPILANAKGISLYVFQREMDDFLKTTCDKACFEASFLPVEADASEKAPADFGTPWTIVDVPGGKRQWAYKGSLIYTFREDTKPGEFRAQRFGGGGWAMISETAAVSPTL